jgi:hypothetical protein
MSCARPQRVESAAKTIDSSPPSKPHKPLRKKPWFWAALSLLGIVVALAAIFTSVVPMSSEVLRQRIVTNLAARLDSDVQLGALQVRVFPGLRAEGSNLTVRRRGTPADIPPLISIKAFHVDANLMGLWRKHVEHVQLDGLDIAIPPKDVRRAQKDLHRAADANDPTKADSAPATVQEKREDPLNVGGVILDRVDTNDARLIMVPGTPGKEPKIWAIHHLRMHDLGATDSWPFNATLANGVPPGEIVVDGGFGPWHREEPGDTPLHGTFNFEKADLGVFKGISGTLASYGDFNGTLDQLHANGVSDTPDFTIKVGGHPFPLHVKYTTLIDGTNGDTRLENIDAWFLNSFLNAKGAVLDVPADRHGRTIALDVHMERSRIEDIMTMAVKTKTPPMTGGLKLDTKFLLPPGDSDVADRLRLEGKFWIGQAKFTNYDVQGKIEELSKRGRAKTAEPVKARVASDFQGRFKLADGRLTLPDLTFAVPGAKVQLAGAYALKHEALAFKGQLLLDAKISQTVTGVKSLLLKAIDPLFKQKDGTGSAIPIKIEGTREAPEFGLDVKRVFNKGDN